MIQIGKYSSLKVVKEVDFGVYLDGDRFGEILLPSRYVPTDCSAGDTVEVFIYRDSEDRIIATTDKPYATVGEFAFLKVVDVTDIGAFLYWGLLKDLFVPFKEQKENKMQKGKFYIVRIYLDKQTERIAASARLEQFLDNKPDCYKKGDEAELMIYSKSELGYLAIINNSHAGLIYNDDVFTTLNIGQKITGYIKNIREDGKIDLFLQKAGYGKVEGAAGDVLKKIEKNGGFIPVTDKSAPEVISKIFGTSKKTYKKAVGLLYKKRIISIEDDGIRIKKHKSDNS
ncbi:MAG: S1-like domain-containing RNA-binding protein [Elusimicrobia bacterium]|jgi:predicted RNA-binding protein (virulence factor B family)|nr:S1-like domain-containing RNA-binding protein [Elusimicrobiota bacterium]